MKKIIGSLLVFVFLLTGCQSGETTQEPEVVKVGLNGVDSVVWNEVARIALEEENIQIELIYFNDYVQPNLALEEGEIDLNAFQTIAFLEESNEKNGWHLEPIATTLKAPMGVYSAKHDNLESIPDGATIAIPNEGSNKGRAFELLDSLGVITLKEDYDPKNITEDSIAENPHNVEFVELTPNQIPRALQDVDYGVINSGVAVDAGFIPTTDALALEPETTTKYINVIAKNANDTEHDETYQKIVDIYQTEVIAELIKSDSKNSQIPTFVDLSEIGW